jgi:hypothetical protein
MNLRRFRAIDLLYLLDLRRRALSKISRIRTQASAVVKTIKQNTSNQRMSSETA